MKASRKRDGQMSKGRDKGHIGLEHYDVLGLHVALCEETGKLSVDMTGAMASEFLSPVNEYIERLNREKVIGQYMGGNVYSLFLPPLPGLVAPALMAGRFRRFSLNRLIPSLATLAITWKCPCSCEKCGLFGYTKTGDTSARDELSTEELFRVIDEACDLGVTNIALSGGEPLLRKDLVELINYVPADKANVLVFTNGALLTYEKVRELAATNLYGIVVSIDSSKPEIHDGGRNLDGLFEKAVAGVRRAQEVGILTAFSTSVTEDDIVSGEFEKRIKFAKETGVVELIVYDTVPAGSSTSPCGLSPVARADFVRLKEIWSSLDGDFKVTIPSLVSSCEGSGCFGGSHRFHMTPDGDICPCDYVPLSFGNVKNDSISAIWECMTSHPAYCNQPSSCMMKDVNFRNRYINTIPGDATMPCFIGEPEKVGVIAGFGEFPIIFTKAVQKAGYEPVVVAIEGESSLKLKEVAPNLLTVGVGELEKVLGFFRSQEVSNIVMIGKVHKEKLFSQVAIDDSLKKVIDSVGIKDDPNLLKAIGMAFHKAGLYITDPSKYLSSLLVPEGILTEKEPTELQMADVKYGFSMAKEIARLGIGQTVVVREGTVLAVEAIEGTDKTIMRASSLSGGKSVVVKVAAPNHDMRYDIPAVGSDTIDTLHKSGASVLAVEAGKTIILDREKVVQQANDKGIVILAI